MRAEFAEEGRFTAHVAGAAASIDGRWLVRDGLALTAVTLPACRTGDDPRDAG